MESEPTWLAVVALALRDETGRLLLQQRPAAKHHANLWEFPGGKVEPGENPRAALVREIAEELGIEIVAEDLRPTLVADECGQLPIVLMLYSSRLWSGTIVPDEGQAWGWFALDDARELPLAPMDADLLTRMTQ